MTGRTAIHPPGAERPPIHASPGIRCGEYLFVGAQTATDWVTARPQDTHLPHLGDSTRAEVRRAFGNLKGVVEAAGMDLMEVARVDNFYGSRTTSTGHFAARDEFYRVDPMLKPASTAVQMSRLLPDGCTYAVEAIGITGDRTPIVTDRVQASPGRLPMGTRAGDFMFLSGRMASDYKEGLAAEARTRPWIWIGSPIRAQTEYVLGMHRDILEEAGASLADVVKSEIFLLDPGDITVLDEVWREFFPTDPPARSIFIVDGLGIQDAVIEINHVALHP
jgi:2-aminomuconate deaminase